MKDKKLPVQHFIGCLVGGAIGDALGAPIEFNSIASIRAKYGANGISDYVENPDGTGEFTDDTQMTLFTAEALLMEQHRAMLRGIPADLSAMTHRSYLRWLHTQGIPVRKDNLRVGTIDFENGWLLQQKLLYERRAPGNTIISSLSSGHCGTIQKPINNSKGCGTVMKIAPVGLFYYGQNKTAFEIACAISAITHGHPSGYLSAGFLASVIADIANGLPLMLSLQNALDILKDWKGNDETLHAVERALILFEETKHRRESVTPEEVEKLGGAWVAEEALAISLYASLLYEDGFERGVLLAVNHSGDSDSTGAITGNILGLINGYESIPLKWRQNLIGQDIVKQVAEDLFIRVKGNTFKMDEEWWEKYPGY